MKPPLLKAFHILLFICFILSSCRDSEQLVLLTEKEQQWLKENENNIRVAQDPSYPPVEFLDEDGNIVGISNDYLDIIEKKLNIHFIRTYNETLKENLNEARKGNVEMVTSIAKTPQRSEFLIFTSPYFESPAVIIVHGKEKGILHLEDLKEKKISVTNSYAVHDFMVNHHPYLHLDLVTNDLVGLKKLVFNETDALIADLGSVSFYQKKSGISNLHVAGNTDFTYRIAIGIRKDLPILESIINKTLTSISQSKRDKIHKKWVYLSTKEFWETRVFWYWFILFLIVITGVSIYIFTWNRTLKSQVLKRTQELNKELEIRLETEQSLKESENRYRIVAGQKGQIVYDYDFHKRIILWSGDIKNITGYTPQEHKLFSLKEWKKNIHPDDINKTNLSLDKAISSGKDYEATYRYRHKSGHYVPIQDNGTFLLDQSGKPYRMLGIMRDITTQQLRENELRQAREKAEKADQLKTMFLANMSHEVRTPMNGIVGFASLLTQDNITPDKLLKYSHIIQQSTHHLQKIIDDILDISMIESGQFKINKLPINLNNVILSVIQYYDNHEKTKKKDVVIIHENGFEDGHDQILTDEIRLRQILVNLVGNALKYTHNGHILISYKTQEVNKIIFEVRDTGIGIPNNETEHIFERFRQVKYPSNKNYGGTGLGLSISKGLVELLGGKIWCESKLDEGTSFFFTLPYSKY